MHGLHALLRRLDPGHVSGTLIAVMCANPLAFQAGRRCAPQDNVDLNRVFPGTLSGNVSHRLAYGLFSKVVTGADFLLTLHSWGSAGIVMPYVEYPAGDSAVARASYQTAVAFGVDALTPLEWHPGLLPAAANRAGIPAAEVEIGGGATARPGLTRLYSGGMESVLRHWGLLKGAPARAKHPQKMRRHDIATPIAGLLRRRSALGARVKAGGLLGTIVDIYGDAVAEIRSPADGVLGAYRLVAHVSKRDGVFSVFELMQ
jgi:predicted deacylase